MKIGSNLPPSSSKLLSYLFYIQSPHIRLVGKDLLQEVLLTIVPVSTLREDGKGEIGISGIHHQGRGSLFTLCKN